MKTFKQLFNEARCRRIQEQRDYLKSHPKHVHKPFRRAGGLNQVTEGDKTLRVPRKILEFWECRCGLGYVKRGTRFYKIPESQLHRPCSGPSQAHSYAEGDRAYQEVIELLETKYYLSKTIAHDGCSSFTKQMEMEFRAEKEKLRAALRELIWIDDAAGF